MRKASQYFLKIYIFSALLILVGCSPTRHVPEGKYLVDKVDVVVDDNAVQSKELINYLRISSNHRILKYFRFQLGLYNISGKDSTKWYNKMMRKAGDAPKIYNQELVDISVSQLRKAMINRGYMDASVAVDTISKKKKRINVKFTVTSNNPHYISSLGYNIPNDTIRNIIMADSANFAIHESSLFDRNKLEEQRLLITEKLRNHGYYAFNKEYVTYTADTTENSKAVDLVLNVMPPLRSQGLEHYDKHRKFHIRNVYFITNYNPLDMHDGVHYEAKDTVLYKGYNILYGESRYLRPSVLVDNCYLQPGKIYSLKDINRTYSAFGRLSILKFININMQVAGEFDGKVWLDAYVLLTEGRSQSVSLELEGTNSEGNLGFAIGAQYQHRNIGKGSEQLNTKARVSYESLSGDISSLINNRYTEYGIDVDFTFPKFMLPFTKDSFKRKIRATTTLGATFDFQQRPEYTRVIAGGGWKYKWSEHSDRESHTFDVLDINYVYLPRSSSGFLDSIAPDNPLLRYSYEDHFIMRMGYSYYRTNKKMSKSGMPMMQPNVYTLRAAGEFAGNVLYGFSNMLNQGKGSDGLYKIFGIRYSQYVKLDFDYSLLHTFDYRNSFAFHVGAGVGVPYGNSTVLPFEKRFYGGGANGVRGWGVRTLGPGAFDASNTVSNFLYQCGDIRFDINLEYRAKLFWVLELGAFVDAGNIWTIREYETQPGGVFKLKNFYKEIAMSYGLGLRLNFTYFLLRFDLGMKAHNPARNAERWPLIHPNWGRDATFHFAVGYPF